MMLSIRRALAVSALATAAGAAALQAQGGGAPPPAPPAKPAVTVSGVVYAQYLYQLNDTINSQNNFDVTRAYINVLGNFVKGVQTRITADIYSVSDASGTGGSNNDNGSYDYRLKYAYVGYTPEGSPLTARFGLTQTPWLDWEEALWDYRMQGAMAMDRDGYMTAADFGAALDGTWNKHQFDFQAGIYNGEGYHGGVGDENKNVDLRVSARLLETDDMSRIGGLRVTIYGGYGKPKGGGVQDRGIVNLSYKSKMLTLAAEAASTVDSTYNVSKLKTNGHVYSAYGVFHVPQSDAALLARVDIQAPQSDVANNETTRLIVGASYQLTPNLRLLLPHRRLRRQANPHRRRRLRRQGRRRSNRPMPPPSPASPNRRSLSLTPTGPGSTVTPATKMPYGTRNSSRQKSVWTLIT